MSFRNEAVSTFKTKEKWRDFILKTTWKEKDDFILEIRAQLSTTSLTIDNGVVQKMDYARNAWTLRTFHETTNSLGRKEDSCAKYSPHLAIHLAQSQNSHCLGSLICKA